MVSVRSLLFAFLVFILTPAGALAECRGGAVSGIPACTGGYGDYGTGEPSALGLWIQDQIAKREAKAQRYNNLLEQMDWARKNNDIYRFNQLGDQALALFDKGDLRRWINNVNFDYKSDLAFRAAKEGRHADALNYAGQLGPITPSNQKKWLRDFILWNEIQITLLKADDTSRTARERIALYDEIARKDRKFFVESDKAYIEWLRGRALEEAGKPKEALRHYQRALRMPGNDTEGHRAVIAVLRDELAPPRDKDVVELNPGALTTEAAQTANTTWAGAPAGADTALQQLNNAAGGQTGGQTFDGGGGADPVYASISAVGEIESTRVFSPKELERYGKSEEFVRQNAAVDMAVRLAGEARARKSALQQQQSKAASDTERQQLQIEIQKADQEITLRKSEKRVAEIARDAEIKRIDGEAIFVE